MTFDRCYPNQLLTITGILSLGISALTADLSAQRMRIGSSNPTGYSSGTAYSDALFAAGDTARGVELWYAGSAGTSMLLDVVPGSRSSYPTEITRRGTNNAGICRIESGN